MTNLKPTHTVLAVQYSVGFCCIIIYWSLSSMCCTGGWRDAVSGLSVNLSVFVLYASLLSSPFFNCSSVSISHLTVFSPLFYCLHLHLSLFNLLCLTGRRNSRCLVVVLKIVFCMTDASPHLASAPSALQFSFSSFLWRDSSHRVQPQR